MIKKLCLLLLVVPGYLHAQNIAGNAEKLLNAYTVQHKFSGAVLIAKNDKIIFNKAFGYSDIADKKSNSTNTQFRAGSLTKMFTSALIMQLVKDKKLKLDDPVSKYLPSATWANNITIKNLLSHTSGIHGRTPENTIELNKMVENFMPDTTHFEPGKHFEYNNFNYILLGYIAQKIMKTDYSILVKKLVLDKAGLSNSGVDYYERPSQDKARGYTLNPSTGEWADAGGDKQVSAASGAGALYTTTGDLFKWATYVERQLKAGNTSFTQSVTPVSGEYGLGWIIRDQSGHHMIGHTGSIPGFLSMLMMFPQDSTTIIFLSNFQDMNTNEFINNLVAVTFDEPYQLPVEKDEVDLPLEILKEYVGTYGEDASGQLKVYIENNKLMVLAPGGDTVPLSAVSKDNFYIKGPDIVVKFNRTNDSIVSVFVSMGNQTLKKIN